MQFKDATKIDLPVSALTGQQLMWAFFGYSEILPIFIGILQIIGGLLLLSNKTKLFGVAILLPILTNIILMDLVYHANQGALFNAIFYFSILFFVLFFEREKLVEIIKIVLKNEAIINKMSNKDIIKTTITVCTIVVLLIFLSNFINTHISF